MPTKSTSQSLIRQTPINQLHASQFQATKLIKLLKEEKTYSQLSFNYMFMRITLKRGTHALMFMNYSF